MANKIAMIPADNQGTKLFIKDFRIDEKNRMFLKYKSTFNDIPFRETQIFAVDENNVVICDDDGTVIFRFPIQCVLDISS